MKSLMSIILQFVNDRPTRLNVIALLRFLLGIAALVMVYSLIFHYIMQREGRSESWVTGVYWTLTVMTTLGFGDITFQSDLGKIFSSIVLLSGIIFFLILLPFTFIEFFYAPWMRAQQTARTPTQLPEKTKGHAILTQFDAVTRSLIEKFGHYHYTYVLLVADIKEALRLHELGYRVMVGDLDDPQTYRLARVDKALFVASTASDQVNANVAFTVREITPTVPVITTASYRPSVDILELAGSTHVLQLGEIMGQALARQVMLGVTTAHDIGQFGGLMIAEAGVRGTSLVGKTLQQTDLRQQTGINVLGVWVRGKFQTATPDTLITPNTILMVAGTEAQIGRYNELYGSAASSTEPVVVLGGGRVGRAVGRALIARGIDYRIVEKAPERVQDRSKYVIGDAAELEVLEEAGIRKAAAIIITTHDDDMNVYLTIYCRRLRPDAQIICRSNVEQNIETLHRAGADFVMSYASTGANAIINLIGRDNILMVAEGLSIFEVQTPPALVGKTLAETHIRRKTGCTVVALRVDDHPEVMPDPHLPLPADSRLILIGTPEAEERFLKLYKE